ncbi:MAG TPA: dipicolinate synthase subunit DpsA [Clostridia bacterium]|nr:dipicolinate synthase subunit DpsA [Clostridia bacterium]
MPLKGIRIAVLGGDARQVIVAGELHNQGALVKTFGLSFGEPSRVEQCGDLESLFRDVQVLILPMPGMNDNGEVYTSFGPEPIKVTGDLVNLARKGLVIYVGVAKPILFELTRGVNAKIVELAEIDELAILNSIPTAEGALKIAFEKTPFTLHGSSVFVLGFGRTGMTMARVVYALGAKTTVVARKEWQLARAYEMGFSTVHLNDISNSIGRARIIFNTIPAPVITRDILEKTSTDCLIVDLASSPGGTDFKAAKEQGVEAILAPGLPGKVAPQTAGFMVTKVVSRLLRKEMTKL